MENSLTTLAPLVSIIVPCYNQGQYLSDALDSVLAQTYTHWECIVVNDASTDNTAYVAEVYAKSDNRIILVNAQKNGGLASSRNLGISYSKGEFILPLDADDKLDETYLDTVVPVLLSQKSIKLVFTNTQCFGLDNSIMQFRRFSLQDLCIENQLNCTGLYRKRDFDTTDGYRLNMIYGYEDWDFWMQLLTGENQLYHIDKPLLQVRIKENAMHKTLTQDIFKEAAMRRQLFLNNPSFFAKYQRKNASRFARLFQRLLRTFPAFIIIVCNS